MTIDTTKSSTCTAAHHATLKACPEKWATLTYRGIQSLDVGDGEPVTHELELRDCPCGSTLARRRPVGT